MVFSFFIITFVLLILTKQNMDILLAIGLIILAVIIIIGIIRVCMIPYTGIIDLILDMFLLDLLFDLLGAIFENLGDIFD